MGLSAEEHSRYSRHLSLKGFGPEAQLKLKNARVLVVGAGGLGSPCLLYLAAAGVGYIGIADDDVVSLSNLQRQVLYDTAHVGMGKAELAKQILREKNSNTEVFTYGRINPENVLGIIKSYHLIIDGSDNLATRYLLNDACVISGKPYIYGALSRFEGQLSTFNWNGGPTYRCLFPQMASAQEVPGCQDLGVLGVLAGIIGTMQATEAIKVITGIGEPLSGKLLSIDLLSFDTQIISFSLNPENLEITGFQNLREFCLGKSKMVDYQTLTRWLATDEIQLLDVRDESEFERFNIGGLNISDAEVQDWFPGTLNLSRKIVVLCRTGQRSAGVAERLGELYPELQVYNLKGGLEAAF